MENSGSAATAADGNAANPSTRTVEKDASRNVMDVVLPEHLTPRLGSPIVAAMVAADSDARTKFGRRAGTIVIGKLCKYLHLLSSTPGTTLVMGSLPRVRMARRDTHGPDRTCQPVDRFAGQRAGRLASDGPRTARAARCADALGQERTRGAGSDRDAPGSRRRPRPGHAATRRVAGHPADARPQERAAGHPA